MKSLKVGVIGGGFGLKIQAPIINLHPSMEVSAVSTLKRHQLPEILLNEQNVPNHYKDWQEMIKQENLDLVFVSSMPILHFEMAKFALEHGLDVVCEKPFTENSYQSKELVELAEKTGQKLLLDFEWRYLPGRQKVKELVDHGRVGKVLHYEYHMSIAQYQKLLSSKRGWLGDKSKAGGMLGALGSHLIDCMRWLTTSEVERVNGLLMTHVPEGGGEQRVADDGFLLQGLLENGASYSIQLLSGVNHGFGSRLKVFGTEGTIVLDNDQELKFGAANEELASLEMNNRKIPDHLSDQLHRYYPAFYPYLEKVYDYIVTDQLDRDLATVLDGHENQKILDQIREG